MSIVYKKKVLSPQCWIKKDVSCPIGVNADYRYVQRHLPTAVFVSQSADYWIRTPSLLAFSPTVHGKCITESATIIPVGQPKVFSIVHLSRWLRVSHMMYSAVKNESSYVCNTTL